MSSVYNFKLTHLMVFMINHHIMWLHISMHDSHAVAVVQGLQTRGNRLCYPVVPFFSSQEFQNSNTLKDDAACFTTHTISDDLNRGLVLYECPKTCWQKTRISLKDKVMFEDWFTLDFTDHEQSCGWTRQGSPWGSRTCRTGCHNLSGSGTVAVWQQSH